MIAPTSHRSSASQEAALHPLHEPLEIKRGSVSVTIYPTWNRIYRPAANTNRRELKAAHPEFTLAYYSGTQRIKKKFTDLVKAKAEAQSALDKLAKGDNAALKLTGKEAMDYANALANLRKWNVEADLNLVVIGYVEAVKFLPADVTLRQAAKEYADRRASIRASRTVPELVDEFIAAKEKAGKSARYLGDMRSRLGAFKRVFQLPVQEVTAPMLQLHLDGLPVSNRSKLNLWRLILSAFHFAVKRKYAPRDLLEELEGVERPQAELPVTEVFTPDELREMLESARPSLVPWLAIGAFTGLRTAEIMRLDWRDVNLGRRLVEVKAINAKTAARRVVPLGDAAVAWLKPRAQPEGRVAHFAEENKFCKGVINDVNRARRAAGNRGKFKWKRNGLRHAYCSYRLAILKDVGRVALEAGNSANMIFKHYRELVHEEEAARWFGAFPPKLADNIIPIIIGSAAAKV